MGTTDDPVFDISLEGLIHGWQEIRAQLSWPWIFEISTDIKISGIIDIMSSTEMQSKNYHLMVYSLYMLGLNINLER